jgi:hypothetical protein
VEQLFNSINPLLRDREGSVPLTDDDERVVPPSAAFVEEQHLVAKIVHLMKSDDTDTLLRIYTVARKVWPYILYYIALVL